MNKLIIIEMQSDKKECTDLQDQFMKAYLYACPIEIFNKKWIILNCKHFVPCSGFPIVKVELKEKITRIEINADNL